MFGRLLQRGGLRVAAAAARPAARRCCGGDSTMRPLGVGWLSRRAAAAPSRQLVVGSPLPFDTYSLVVLLEKEGFSRGQAQALTRTLLEVLRGSIRNSEAGLVKKAELSEALLKLEGRMAEGKAEVRTLREAAERGWSSAVREESVRRREATDKLSTRLKEEIDKLASNGRLDMNLERARAKEELRVSQDELLAEAKRIEGMLLNHQQEILKMKNDLFKVRSCVAFLDDC